MIKIDRNNLITMHVDDFIKIVKEIAMTEKAEANIIEAMSKPQLTFTEACRLFGDNRMRKWIKSGNIKPASQNGKGTAIYYDTQKLVKLSQVFNHSLLHVKL